MQAPRHKQEIKRILGDLKVAYKQQFNTEINKENISSFIFKLLEKQKEAFIESRLKYLSVNDCFSVLQILEDKEEIVIAPILTPVPEITNEPPKPKRGRPRKGSSSDEESEET